MKPRPTTSLTLTASLPRTSFPPWNRSSTPPCALSPDISEEQSLHRYAPDKWSIRQVLNHVSDTERVFLYRALWFARGFDTPLPSFEQERAAAAADADQFSWASHVEEFRAVRTATLAFFRNLPADAWDRAGNCQREPRERPRHRVHHRGPSAHHSAVLRQRYFSRVRRSKSGRDQRASSLRGMRESCRCPTGVRRRKSSPIAAARAQRTAAAPAPTAASAMPFAPTGV